MSNNWKVGDIAILCNAKRQPQLNGHECTIIQEFGWYSSANRYWEGEMYCCRVETSDGKTYSCEPHQLKRLDPPNIKTVWDENIFKPSIHQPTKG